MIVEVRPRETRAGGLQGINDPVGWRRRQTLALLAALGLWTDVQIAAALGTTRYAVARAKDFFHVVEVP